MNYISLEEAQAAGLFSSTASNVRMAADSTNIGTGRGRNTVRIESKKSYNHGLIILDLNHMPEGCGTWPAFWLYGPDWPTSGEVDIIEGVNSQAANSFAVHTNPGCSITDSGAFTGHIETPNCDVNAPGQATNAGCAITTPDTQSYGTGFNSNGGGVYATEWTSEAISIWFFPRSRIPPDIASTNPQPSGWGPPHAQFAGACDIDTYVRDQNIVFTNTFCGDWGGQVWGQDATCAPLASTCQEFVQNNPGAFANAYWDINSLRVYQMGGNSSSAPVPVPPPAPSEGTPSPPSAAPSTLVTVTIGGSSSVVVAPQPQPGPSQSPIGGIPDPFITTTAPYPTPVDGSAPVGEPAANEAGRSKGGKDDKPDAGAQGGEGTSDGSGSGVTLWSGKPWRGGRGRRGRARRGS